MRIPFLGGRHRRTGGRIPDAGTIDLLSDCVLEMSMAFLRDEDVAPLYAGYMDDDRLGSSEKQELTDAFRALRSESVGLPRLH